MGDTDTDDWGAAARIPAAERLASEALIIDVDGFEGPLDLLLMLSRTQKVDLRKISVLQLAENIWSSCSAPRPCGLNLPPIIW